MSRNTLTALKLIILLLPFCVLSGLVLKAELSRDSLKTWTINIQGFDPRDMLHGQYLQFKFDWEWAGGQPEECVSCCVCLQDRTSASPLASIVSCELPETSLPQCGAVIRSWDTADKHHNMSKPYDLPFRFYIPEQHAKELQQKLNNFSPDGKKDRFSVRMNVTPQGKMMLRDLLMNGKPSYSQTN